MSSTHALVERISDLPPRSDRPDPRSAYALHDRGLPDLVVSDSGVCHPSGGLGDGEESRSSRDRGGGSFPEGSASLERSAGRIQSTTFRLAGRGKLAYRPSEVG